MRADHNAFLIRSARSDDAHNLSVMMVASWRETYGEILSAEKLNDICNIWLTPEKFEARINDENACNLIAIIKDKVVGHAHVLPRHNHSLLLAYLYVRKNHARKGIGQTLLKTAIECFPGTEHIELGVFESNHAAIEFYKSIGFFESGPEPTRADEPASIKMTMVL